MSEENVEVVRRVYEAAARRDAEAVLALYDPKIEWDVSRSRMARLVGGGVYSGHEGLRQFFAKYHEAWADIEYEATELIDAGEFDVSIRPEGRVYRGRDGVAEAMRSWTGTWDDFRYEVQEIIDAGDRVVLVDRQSGQGKGSGAPLDQQTFSVFTIREGKILRVVWLPTREQALKAAGLSE